MRNNSVVIESADNGDSANCQFLNIQEDAQETYGLKQSNSPQFLNLNLNKNNDFAATK